ncbi:MAG: hypothetical protein K0R05_3637 [Anaerocolumna sp.]|jgi:hypothetical protein|nr:hypothetical protein [Anaerocolumna sp.]
MSEQLKDYEPYQELIKEYPNAQKVQSNTNYILSEIVSDQNGEIIKTTEKTFSDRKSMDKYQEEKEIENIQSNFNVYTVNPGETVYNTTYTQMQIGLSLYKYTSNRLFVACVYDWLTPPATLLDYTKGIVGLALASMMSMDGSSYAGRVTAVQITSGKVKNYTSSNGRLSIQATGNNTIGYFFSLPYASSDVYGVISCEAYKNFPEVNYCNAFGEYDSINYILDISNFSVSYPTGISIGTANVKTPYTVNDALNLR